MLKNLSKLLVAVAATATAFSLGLSLSAPVPAAEIIVLVERPLPSGGSSYQEKPVLEDSTEPTPEEVETLDSPLAVSVEPSVVLKTADDVAKSPNETVFRTMETQGGATWGLDVIDGNRDGSYTYVSTGAGVRIYIVDTGVDAAHPEFSGRVADGFDAFGQNLDQTDCNGHGTHVAGIAAGSYFGVAKKSTIVPVRVMDCNGIGNTTTLTDGIEWILASHSGGIGIVNMSIGGSLDSEVNAAVEQLVSAGLIVVVAAGNSGADACSYSPVSAYGVIGVGALDKQEKRASFSNWGDCVDMSAPGVGINSANVNAYNMSKQMNGTSQASPFVAGALATFLSNSVKNPEALLYELSQNGALRVQAEPEQPVEQTPEPVVEPEPVAPEPEPSPSPIVDEPIIPDFSVSVEQTELGSNKGILRWSGVSDADSFEIHKASSIRPGWRVWDIVPGDANARVVIDQPGVTAVYKVVALVGSEKVEIGIFVYEPKD